MLNLRIVKLNYSLTNFNSQSSTNVKFESSKFLIAYFVGLKYIEWLIETESLFVPNNV